MKNANAQPANVDAASAKEMGLVNKVVPDDDLHGHVADLAHRLAKGPTKAYVRARELVHASTHNDAFTQMELEAAGILAAGETDDFREGVEAFIEKRKPDFTGR